MPDKVEYTNQGDSMNEEVKQSAKDIADLAGEIYYQLIIRSVPSEPAGRITSEIVCTMLEGANATSVMNILTGKK